MVYTRTLARGILNASIVELVQRAYRVVPVQLWVVEPWPLVLDDSIAANRYYVTSPSLPISQSLVFSSRHGVGSLKPGSRFAVLAGGFYRI